MLQRSAGVVLAVALLFFLLQRSPAPQRAPTPTQAPASHPRQHHDSYSLPPATLYPQMDPFLSIFRSAPHRRSHRAGSSADHRQGLNQKTGHTSLHPYPKPTTPRRPHGPAAPPRISTARTPTAYITSPPLRRPVTLQSPRPQNNKPKKYPK